MVPLGIHDISLNGISFSMTKLNVNNEKFLRPISSPGPGVQN